MSKQKTKLGRPTVMTPKKIGLLQHAFDIGATDEEACVSAQISPSTLYNYQADNPDFLEEKKARKLKPVLLAKETIYNALLAGDINITKWYLERKKKDEFSLRPIEANNKEDKYLQTSERRSPINENRNQSLRSNDEKQWLLGGIYQN